MDELPRHPIAVAAARSGLSTDVLRVWERRYAAVTPARMPNGVRLYTDSDIERLRLMSAAVNGGRSIGRVAALSSVELARLVLEDAAAGAGRARDEDRDSVASAAISAAMDHTRALDSSALRDTLRRAVASLGVGAFADSIAGPLMRRIGDDWHAGAISIAQEHLATAVVHDLLLDIMRGVGPKPGAPRVVVATPSGERHVIGAAMFGAIAASDGWNVTWLGADLPAREIAEAAMASRATAVALGVVHLERREERAAEIRALRAMLPGVRIIVGGAGAAALEPLLAGAGIEIARRLRYTD